VLRRTNAKPNDGHTLRTGGGSGEAFEYGGPGRDVLYGAGTIGTMTLDAGTGSDVVVARPSGYPSTVTGGDGADIIAIYGVDSSPYEPDGRFTIDAGAGDDTVIGGIHDDTVDAGADRDFVDVRDGGSDTVTCGSGLDVVRFDAGDTIAADCEIRLAGS
jgi:hypothetical protein